LYTVDFLRNYKNILNSILILTTSPRFSSTYDNKRGHKSKFKLFGCFTFFESR
jgi:hypothetical protein